MPAYIVDVSVSLTVEANTEEEAFGIGHSLIPELEKSKDYTEVEGEVIGVEEA